MVTSILTGFARHGHFYLNAFQYIYIFQMYLLFYFSSVVSYRAVLFNLFDQFFAAVRKPEPLMIIKQLTCIRIRLEMQKKKNKPIEKNKK